VMVNSMKPICGIIVFIIFGITGCNNDDPVGPDPDEEVSFSQHVLPIFQQNGCTGCHGASPPPENNLRVDSVTRLLQGGVSGPAIIPGDADGSLLIRQMSDNPPLGNRMPLGMSPVPQNQQNTIRRWINEGAEDN
jgi:hypothetical protein